MNFKSNAAYKAWLGYGHASGEFAKTPGNQPVSIKGKSHNVQHAMGGNLYAAGGSFNNPGFQSLPPAIQEKIRNSAGYGGQLFAGGGPMSQITEFKAGGSHEENPLGGIPQGMSPDGRLNLVEEGELKRNRTDDGEGDYVYSDRINVEKDIAELYGLPKTFIGKTFAAASKLANRPNSRRENDTIEEQDIKRKLTQVEQAQEAQKAEMDKKEKAEQLAANPALLDALTQQLAANQSVQPMGMPQGQPMDPNQMDPAMLAQMEGAAQGQPIMAYGGHMYMCGGKMYDFGGFVDNNSAGLAGAGTGALSGASTGAMIGSAVPGIGTVIGAGVGAVVGGTAGFFKGHKQDKAEEEARQTAQQQQLAQSNQMNYAPQSPYVTPAATNTVGGLPTYSAAQGGPLYHEYPQINPDWKNHAGPMGQGLTNTQIYKYGGSFDMPRQQMYMPLDNVEAFGGNMFTRELGGGDPLFKSSIENTQNLIKNVDADNNGVLDYLEKNDNSELENLQVDLVNAESKEEYDALMEKYKSAVERLNTEMTDQNLDLTIKANPLEAAAMALPAAYNIGQGLFGKVSQLNAEDYTNTANIEPYQYNINPQLREAQYTYAQAQDAIKNAGISGGNYASNMQQLANTRNEDINKLYTEKQNLDAQSAMQAQLANSQINTQNKALKMNVDDYNARARAAKQGLLGTGLSQVAHIGDAFLNMKKDATLAKAMAPDFSETLKLILGTKNIGQ
jgi:hypothetical protein